MRIIDLSQDIYEGMKVYPGHLKTVQFEPRTRRRRRGSRAASPSRPPVSC
jgi:kynurenine formamidase